MPRGHAGVDAYTVDRGTGMSLDHTKRTYEKFGREDPLYAVLTTDQFRHGQNEDQFFASGREEIARVMTRVGAVGIEVARGRALDFGCGVGRLTQALADHFERVVGVDIAASMVERARQANRHGDRVQYLVNAVDDLRALESGSFDFVYSNITLQHVPPEASRRYIAEFMRVLRPGGAAVFQVPSGRPYPAGGWQEWLYRVRRQYLRRLWKTLRGKPPYEMHYVARPAVEQIIDAGAGRLVEVTDVGRRPGRNFMYYVVKQPGKA